MTGHNFVTVESSGTVYKPLYPPEGGPLGGFLCCQCHAVTRTKRGILLHLSTCHGIRMQHELPFEPPENSEPQGAPELPVKTSE